MDKKEIRILIQARLSNELQLQKYYEEFKLLHQLKSMIDADADL